MGDLLAHLRDNFRNTQDRLDGLMAGQALLLADSEAMLLLCKQIGDTIGIEAIDGLSIIDWFNREKLRRLEKVLQGIEDTSPGLAAMLQQTIDTVRLTAGMHIEVP